MVVKEGHGAEIGLPRGRHVETCPARAFEAWQEVAQRKAGPLFRRISTAGRIGDAALHPDAVRQILAYRVGLAGLVVDGFERLRAHALRVGFITEAYGRGVRDENITASWLIGRTARRCLDCYPRRNPVPRRAR